jgi:hypothetical protein
LKYKLIIVDNVNRVILYEQLVEADDTYGAAQIADKIYEDLGIPERDTSMELIEHDSKND